MLFSWLYRDFRDILYNWKSKSLIVDRRACEHNLLELSNSSLIFIVIIK